MAHVEERSSVAIARCSRTFSGQSVQHGDALSRLLEVAVGGFLAALILGLLLTVGGVVFGLLSGKTKEESGKGETPTENGERQ